VEVSVLAGGKNVKVGIALGVEVGGKGVSVGKGWLDGEQADSAVRSVSRIIVRFVA
jgi:hypothetical protein